MSFLNDLVALAKAGYSPAEVKELMQAAKESGYESEPAPAEDKTKVIEPEKPAAKTEITEKEKPADDKDYKALYEATKKDLESLQQKNTQENIKPADVDRDALFKNIKTSIC